MKAFFLSALRLLGFQSGLRVVQGILLQPPSQENQTARSKVFGLPLDLSDLANHTIELNCQDLPFEFMPLDHDDDAARAPAHSKLSPALSRGRPLIWVHLHKAAGSFMCRMAEHAGESIISPHVNCNWRSHDGYRDSGSHEAVPECAQRVKYMKDQGSSYAQIERELHGKDLCFDLFDYGVLLREPIELILSFFNFQEDDKENILIELRNRLNAGNPIPTSPDQFSESWKFLDNIQVRLLANALDVPAGKLNGHHLYIARQRLSKFRVVGRVEDLVERGVEMFKAIGWSEGLARHIKLKENNVSNRVIHLTPEEDAWLREVNHIDKLLWNEFEGGKWRLGK